MKINLLNCDKNIVSSIEKLCEYFDIQIDNTGITLFVFASDRFLVKRKNNKAEIYYKEKNQIFKGIGVLLENQDKDFSMDLTCRFTDFAIMEDMSRNAVMTVKSVKRLIMMLAILGYNQLELYMEDTFKIDDEPYFGTFRGAYSQEELQEIDSFGKEFGVEIVACIQTLAHLKNILKWKNYSSTILDCDDVLLCGEEKTYELLEKIICHISKNISSRKINIGFDEAHRVGLGKYLDIHGYQNRYDILFNHLGRVCEILKKYNLKPIMWSDMFFKLIGGGYYNDNPIPQFVKDRVPKEMSLCYWHYYCKDKSSYDRMMKRHLEFNRDVWFAGGMTSWMTFTPANKFTEEIVDSSFESCVENGIKHYVFTDWGDDGAECSVFASLPVIFRLAQKAYGYFNENSFQNLFGVSYNEFCSLDYPSILKSGQNELTNCSKYILYNDCLCGLLDKNIDIDETYYGEQLDKIPNLKGQFEGLFNLSRELMRIIQVKWNIGVETRKAYLQKNKKRLKELIEVKYKPLLSLINKFYRTFRNNWFDINKPFGWEIQDVRIGGLKQRVQYSIERIEDYINCKIEKIEELEEDICFYDGNDQEKVIRVPLWSSCVSTNNL